MEYKLTTLNNGLRVMTMPIPTSPSATLTVWVGVGSRYEDKNVNGLSHFLEHMAFKGSKRYPSASQVSIAIDSLGAASNAGTSREWTNFYIKSRAEVLEKTFDIISDMLINPFFKKEDIERERGVILEEIALYEDTPIEKIGDIFSELIFSGSPLGRDISGTRQTVKKIQKKDFERYRKTYYGALNMLITVAGGVEASKVNKLARKYFGKLGKRRKGKAKKFISKQRKPQVRLVHKDSEQAHFILGFLAHGRGYRHRYAEAVLATILGSGRSSRLYTEIREKRGLAYAVSTSIARFVDIGFFATYTGVDLGKIEDAITVVLEQSYGLAKASLKISKDELVKSKEYIKGRTALALEDTRSVNDFFGQQVLFLPKIETPEEIFTKIDKVSVDDVLRVAKNLFKPERASLAIIGPYKSQSRFERLLA